jgi:hypothetical protein
MTEMAYRGVVGLYMSVKLTSLAGVKPSHLG